MGDDETCPADLQSSLASGDDTILVPGARLVGCDLSGLDLSHLDLSEADLTNTLLSGTRLDSTSLSNATLVGANLLDAIILGEVDFSGSDMTGASISLSDRAILAMVSEAASLQDMLWRILLRYHRDLTLRFPEVTGLLNPFGNKDISPVGEYAGELPIAANLERYGWDRWSSASDWYSYPFRWDWHPLGSHLALVTGDEELPPHLWNEVTIISVESGEETRLEAAFVKPGRPRWNRTGAYIAALDEYHLLDLWSIPVLRVWSFPGLDRVATVIVPGEQLGEVVWTGVQDEVAVLSSASQGRVSVNVFDLDSGAIVRRVETRHHAVNDAAWSPNGKWLAVAAARATFLLGENGVSLFDGASLQERVVLPLAQTLFDGDENIAFRHVSWSSDGTYLIIQDSLGGWIFWPASRLDRP